MRRISNAVRLDYRTGRFYLLIYPLLFLVGLVIGAVAKMPIFTVVLTIVLAVFISSGVFSINERNHGERLYGTLPLARKDVVLGRYVFGLTIGVAATVIAGMLGYLASRIAGVSMGAFGPKGGSFVPGYDSLLFWAAIGLAFCYFCFSMAIAFPIYFRFGFSKSYVFTMLPLYLVVLATLLITRKLNLTLDAGSVLDYLAGHLYLPPIIGVAAGLVFLVVSFLIANSVYARKEI
ncbi:MAG TPA: ABC-2 transporter permease [Micromonosporaceae bacterium]|jgi:hypothetical protein